MTKYVLMGLTALALVACNDAGLSNVADAKRAEAGFDTFSESVVTQEASTHLVQIPQIFDTVSETVRVQPAAAEYAKTTQAADGAVQGADPAGIFLAYRYGYGLVMPSKSVKATSDKHIQMCRDAGPRKCQVTGSNTNSYSDDNISANVALRAEPDWLVGFVKNIKSDIAEVDGKIQSETSSVDDLTRSILDTDARLKAKRILQKRLENLIETRDAELPDLLALEREIARVHGEIESATANLKALRARVSMSLVNINYKSEQQAVSRSSVSPIGRALKDFVNVLSNGIAGVIYFFAYMLPWTIFLILPGFFAGRWFWRRRETRKDKIEIKAKKTAS